jgi:hypothetical protein
MRNCSTQWRTLTLLAAFLAVIAVPAAARAQAGGQARAVQAVVSTTTGSSVTALADTGTLSGTGDARDASQGIGTVAGVLSGTTLHASTVGSTDTVASEASVADVALSVGGNTIGAGFVMARALAASKTGAAGAASISGLSINGVAIAITGEKNQTISISGGQVIINEQQTSTSGMSVNALHVIVSGVADVVVASAAAGIQ